jgi:hypothetical protein
VSGLASKPLGRFSLAWPQNRWLGFSGLVLKTSSYGLVICDLKSPRQFLGLGLKIKQPSVCRLRHKTDGGRTTRGTRRDLMACFTWNYVALGFPSLTLRLVEVRLWIVHVASSRMLHREKVENRWVDAMGCVGLFYPKITIFIVVAPKCIIIF